MLDLNLKPTREHLRQFGYIACVAFTLVAGMVYWRGELFGLGLGRAAPVVSLALVAISVFSLLSSLLAPAANGPLYIGLSVLTYPLGWVLSHFILAILFYGILTPLGLIFRLVGRDPLRRSFERGVESYWEPHKKVTDKRRYLRQF